MGGNCEWSLNGADLVGNRNESKHEFMGKRRVERGGRRDVGLGTRECQGYIEPCEFGAGTGAYDNTPPMPLGLMLHGITYADESGDGHMYERLWRPVMRAGVVQFVCPEDCPVVRPIRKQNIKTFPLGETVEPAERLSKAVAPRGVDGTLR